MSVIKDIYDRYQTIDELSRRYEESKSIQQRWVVIREYYQYCKPKIMANRRNGGGWSPYHLPFYKHFTPIETNIFNVIRCVGLPFVCQYPVGKYFIDFADPYLKVAIECDGKQHRYRVELDNIRDKFLSSEGWNIFRIEGRHTFRTLANVVRELGLPEEYEVMEIHDIKYSCMNYIDQLTLSDYDRIKELYFTTTSDGIIESINRQFYQHNIWDDGEETY